MPLGALACDARAGSATSAQALADPYHAMATVSRSPFAQPELHDALVDTHFMQRDREGRLLACLARGRLLLRQDTVFGIFTAHPVQRLRVTNGAVHQPQP
jgi:cyanophycinase-like exopeptidase